MAKKIERILVPIDFSPSSKLALQQGAHLAAQLGAQMDVLHVCDPGKVRGTDDVAVLMRGVPGSTLEIYNEQEIQLALSKFLQQAGIERQVRNDEIEQGEDPAALIIKTAAEKNYDLIVMGAHGRTGASKASIGDVTKSVVQGAPCPVQTCRAQE